MSHDEINLKRLVRRLEKSAVASEWPIAGDETYIKVQGALQKVKYARKLLANVELEDLEPSPKTALRYDEFKTILDRVDSFLKELEKKTTPKPTRPAPILPTLPLPPAAPEPPQPQPQRAEPPDSADNLLFDSSSPTSPPVHSSSRSLLLGSEKPTKSTMTTGAQPIPTLQHSTLRQREMADQMAIMAEQLKRNSVYFSELLDKDKRVIEETENKLEGNYGYMQKTRLRTRDLRGKTGGTTCLVLLIIVFVTVLFMFMVSLIRFSSR
ncbi:hypothetical protein C8F01DRAFT_1364295 [Mycena amicta]|nr:hypothetical protein C8F01DRAFT_1364295 [Mycena amicta]